MTLSRKVPNPIDKHVGSRVRMRRMMIAMSQEKLGDALGLTFQQVQKYEKGTNRIGASRLQAIAQILQSPVAFFFEGQQDASGFTTPTEVTDFLATREGQTVAKYFGMLQPGVRRNFAALIEEIATAA